MKLKKNISKKEFRYYQQDGNILGTKVENDIIENHKLTLYYETLVKKLISDKKEVAYIRNTETIDLIFEEYLESLGVEVVDESVVQGEQYDYNIINVKYSSQEVTNELSDYMLKLKSFNTLVSRAINGNIIVDNNTIPIRKSHKGSSKPIDVGLSREELNDYKEFWKKYYFSEFEEEIVTEETTQKTYWTSRR